MDRRFIADKESRARVETRADGTRVITGYGAVFYDPSNPGTEYKLWRGVKERILPGAFDRAIREGDDVRALRDHMSNLLLGRTASGTLRLSVDNTGLRYEIDAPDTQEGRDTMTLIERGDLTGSSFSFTVGAENWRDDKDFEIREITDFSGLFDVGPVTYPAYAATTAGVRNDSEHAEARNAYESHKSAKARAQAATRERELVILELSHRA